MSAFAKGWTLRFNFQEIKQEFTIFFKTSDQLSSQYTFFEVVLLQMYINKLRK